MINPIKSINVYITPCASKDHKNIAEGLKCFKERSQKFGEDTEYTTWKAEKCLEQHPFTSSNVKEVHFTLFGRGSRQYKHWLSCSQKKCQ